MNYTMQDVFKVYALKQAQAQRGAGLPRNLQEANEKLMLEEIEGKRASLLEQRRLIDEAARERSLQNALARQWQRKIEGGANIFRKTGVSPEGVERWEGAWQPGATAEPYEYEGKMHIPKTRAEELAEVPYEARYAYEEYMGIPPTFGQEERKMRAIAETAAMTREETKRRNIEAERLKEEELGYKKEELGYKRVELKEKESRKMKAQIFNIGMKQTDDFEKATEKAKASGDEEAQDDVLQGYLNQMQALINFAKTEYGFEGIENEDIFAEYFADYEKDETGRWVEKGEGVFNVEEGMGAEVSDMEVEEKELSRRDYWKLVEEVRRRTGGSRNDAELLVKQKGYFVKRGF